MVSERHIDACTSRCAHGLRLTLIEASELLGSFDARLREYAARKLIKAGVHLMKVPRRKTPPSALGTRISLQTRHPPQYGLSVASNPATAARCHAVLIRRLVPNHTWTGCIFP
jgi:hypothetical protein